MKVPSASPAIELEVGRIRDLSQSRRYTEALTAAEALAADLPENRDVLYLIAANQRCLSRISDALATLQRLEENHPQFDLLYQERGHCYMTRRDFPRAIAAFERGVNLNPALAASWNALERLYRMTGDEQNAAAAAGQVISLKHSLARRLMDQQKYLEAFEVIKALLRLEPANTEYLSLHAAACVGLGQYEAAIMVYRQLLSASPAASNLHVALGHCLKSVGRQKEAIESYRTAGELRPDFGDTWWSLANLKTYRFSQDELARMRAAETRPATQPVDRYHLCFALGKAYEDRNDYAESWQFYQRGNSLRRAESRYDPDLIETNTRRQIEVCTTDFFSEREGFGAPDPDPIFIVGLPRSGSTLVEQIIASHSQVEGTQELFDIQRIVLEMTRYPDVLSDLALEDLRRLGERYIADTRAYRGGKRFFIDKMPNNFRHAGLIHLILPNARIIDVRREPMACCFSNLKQLFAGGQEFTYSIDDIGRYYRTYLDLMRHWDAVLPGRILRIQYEDVVEDLAGNVQRILEFCGLEFEPACIEFHKTERSVRTASSEQVRQPIFREGLFQWRNYEPWLGPLKSALGDALTRYRE